MCLCVHVHTVHTCVYMCDRASPLTSPFSTKGFTSARSTSCSSRDMSLLSPACEGTKARRLALLADRCFPKEAEPRLENLPSRSRLLCRPLQVTTRPLPPAAPARPCPRDRKLKLMEGHNYLSNETDGSTRNQVPTSRPGPPPHGGGGHFSPRFRRRPASQIPQSGSPPLTTERGQKVRGGPPGAGRAQTPSSLTLHASVTEGWPQGPAHPPLCRAPGYLLGGQGSGGEGPARLHGK